MKTENLKVGDVLIAKEDSENITTGCEYKIIDITNQDDGRMYFINDGKTIDYSCMTMVDYYFTLKETPKGKHIGYIYPFETYRGAKVKHKTILLGHLDFNGTGFNIETGGGTYTIAREVAETFEKAYEPVDDKITIGGDEVKTHENMAYFDGGWYMNKAMLEYWAKHIKTEPNLAEKLELIINKMEK